MHPTFLGRRLVLPALATLLAACAADLPTAPAASRPVGDAGDAPGRAAVYTQTNAAAGNALLVLERRADGTLTAPRAYPTGGAGTGAGLGNQNGVALSRDGQRIAVVNAGSNQVSVFRVETDGLALAATVSSGGTLPVSATLHGDLLYVANEGSASITGFHLAADGTPSPIPGSTQPLSAGVDVGQIQLSPDGATLVVTEKNTNLLRTFPVDGAGVAGPGTAHAASGTTPFGFDFGLRNTVIVSEAFGGASDASAVSSYRADGASLTTVSASVPTTETAACWIVASANGRYAWAANAGSRTITAFAIAPDGALARIAADGVSARTPLGPTDLALSGGDRYLYALNGGSTITAYRVERDGGLTAIGSVPVPAGANGLAAR